MKFVIIHGAFGSPEGNWFAPLKEQLESLSQEVVIPQFPVDDWNEITKAGPQVLPKKQNLKLWLGTFADLAHTFKKNEKLVFIGHSLGPLFILHAVDRFQIQLDSAIFVSPFLDRLGRKWQIDHVNSSFYKTDFDFEKLRKLIPLSYVLYSDNDPYVLSQKSLEFASNLDSSPILIKRAGHMNSEANLNEFPLVLELCKTRLDLSLYQKYLAHRKELFAVDYVKGISEEVVFLQPKDVFDEGIFHFRNLKREGFCTLYTGITDLWDPESVYMSEARKAASRVKQFVRVMVLDKSSDLQKPSIQKQIELDLKAGVRVFICLYEAIQSLAPEPDFGIWDNDYVCIVRFDRYKKTVGEVELNSRSRDIKRAMGWKKVVLDHAREIKDLHDLDVFARALPD